MSRFEIDDQFLGHHKTVRALRKGAEALQMWLAIRTYVAINNSDGIVPDEDIDDLPGAPKSPRKWLAVLVECGKPVPGEGRGPGLVDAVDGGWRLHDYRDHGLSPDEIERRKELSRERQRRWRESRVPNASRNGVTHSPPNAVTNPSSDASGDTPDPIRSDPKIDPSLHGGAKDLSGHGGRDETDPPRPSREISVGARRFAESLNTEAPEELEFTEQHRELARAAGVDLAQTWLECRDQRRAKQYRCASWEAEFTSWLRREAKFQRERVRGSPAKQRQPPQPNDERNRYKPPIFGETT